MKAVIIEDEAAAEVLEGLIGEVAPDIEIVSRLQSIEESVEWFSVHPAPDLVFLDIHLADGSSFTIFEHADISCPIIFTTAYDRYALRAFEVNSVDYLLKPVDREHLERAVNKLRNLRGSREVADANSSLIGKLIEDMRRTSAYKTALLIPEKDKLVPLPVKNIAYIYTEEKIVRAVNFEGKETFIDQPLEEIFSQLDPRQPAIYRRTRRRARCFSMVQRPPLDKPDRQSPGQDTRQPPQLKEFKEWITG